MKRLSRLNIKIATMTILAFVVIAMTSLISLAQTQPENVKVTFVEIGSVKNCIPC